MPRSCQTPLCSQWPPHYAFWHLQGNPALPMGILERGFRAFSWVRSAAGKGNLWRLTQKVSVIRVETGEDFFQFAQKHIGVVIHQHVPLCRYCLRQVEERWYEPSFTIVVMQRIICMLGIIRHVNSAQARIRDVAEEHDWLVCQPSLSWQL